MWQNRLWTDRRTVLSAIGAGAVVAAAGCVGTDDEAEPEDDDADADPTDNDSTTLTEPIAVPDEEGCAVCNMVAAEHPAWNAQLVHEDETRVYFCSSGCLTAYYVAPETFDGPEAAIERAWVTGYETGELLVAEEASFVRVTDSDHVDDIMMLNPTPFADRADAEQFVAGFDAYSDEDIIAIDAFDMELATLYRGRFFDEDDSANQ